MPLQLDSRINSQELLIPLQLDPRVKSQELLMPLKIDPRINSQEPTLKDGISFTGVQIR